ncbi:hypothetical protein CQ018_09225 [Arthrobacter sp. MYb227]|uniref:PH-like domain-containing protein n=1 Tax=Arthrobacter sp. MYb227 TaxID=1848601 RepID=UPI000CFC5592|nr:hypothetical protein [Arthrobacter sp. MYb227]PQZ93820.1 hypothetical protein CQ018_09225 [Arthrobacter sp. MYb227]
MGEYTGAILITIAVIVVCIGLILLGWRNRLRRQSTVPAPPATPENLGAQLIPPSEGQYVSTTTAGDWLDRIAAHQLGIRCNATLLVHDAGVLFARHGAADLFISTVALSAVGRSSGMAGKFVEKDGLLVITWALDEKLVDTGFRPRYHHELPQLVSAISAMMSHGSSTTSSTEDLPPAEDKENQ